MRVLYIFQAFFLLLGLSVFAQSGSHLLVVNGGVFGSNPPVYASLQATDLTSGVTRVLANMRVTAVQDIKIADNRAFIAATDSIFIYDLDSAAVTATLYKKLHYPGVRKVLPYGDKLLVGKFYGIGSFFSVFDLQTEQIIRQVPFISSKVEDIIFAFNDTGLMMVSWNIPKRSIPWQDSIGYITEFNSVNWFPNNFNFLNQNVKVGRLFSDNKLLLISVPDSLKAFYYFVPVSGLVPTYYLKIGLNNVFGIVEGRLSGNNYTGFVYGTNPNGKLGRAILGGFNQTVIDSAIVDSSNIVNALYDTLRASYFVARTNYSGLNKLQQYSATGTYIRDFPVGATPEVMAFYKFSRLSSLPESVALAQLSIYPNPAREVIRLSGFEKLGSGNYRLYSPEGRLIKQGDLKPEIHLEGLNKGLYLLRVIGSSGVSRTISLIKE